MSPDIRRFLLLLCILPLFFASCERSTIVSTLEEEPLFSLEYGNFENQLNVFSVAEVGHIQTSIAMRDGFFYIANGESKKIMEMTSYGDLVRLYFNSDANPEPSFMSHDNAVSATRKATVYPFNQLGAITVDNRQYLYAVDELPAERQELDPDSGAVLRNIILRFDANGSFLDYLGQEGPGGTPFPFVENIYATTNNELVVLCRSVRSNVVYWFSQEGYLLFTMSIDETNVPTPFASEDAEEQHADNGAWHTIGNIIPDYTKRRLYVPVVYYTSVIDEASKVESGINYEMMLLYPLNVDDGRYEQPITIPPYTEQVNEGFSSEAFSIPYDFLGVTDSGWLFFIVSTGNGFSVQMVQPDGQRILTRNLSVNQRNLLYYDFSLNNSGILSLLKVEQGGASLVWWRTDDLIQAVLAN